MLPFNTLIQRAGLVCAFALLGYGLNYVGKLLGPDIVAHNNWYILFPVVGYLIAYTFAYQRLRDFVIGLKPLQNSPAVGLLLVDSFFPAAVFTASYEIAAFLRPMDLEVLSLGGAFLRLLAIFVFIAGISFAVSWKPRAE